MTKNIIRRNFADTPRGQIHYAAAGNGRPVVLLHQTPRSWDEYKEVLPIIWIPLDLGIPTSRNKQLP
jgi:hypothetical protein